MRTWHLLALALLLGVVGGVVGYALASYIARIYVEVALPAAVVKTYDLKVDVAPYQSFTYTNAWIASVEQQSDVVRYYVKIGAESVELYSACVSVVSWGVEYYKGCGLEHSFTMKQIPGGFNVYLTVKGRSLDKGGVITAVIEFEPLPS